MRGERVALCKSVERDEFASTRADFALKLIHQSWSWLWYNAPEICWLWCLYRWSINSNPQMWMLSVLSQSSDDSCNSVLCSNTSFWLTQYVQLCYNQNHFITQYVYRNASKINVSFVWNVCKYRSWVATTIEGVSMLSVGKLPSPPATDIIYALKGCFVSSFLAWWFSCCSFYCGSFVQVFSNDATV